MRIFNTTTNHHLNIFIIVLIALHEAYLARCVFYYARRCKTCRNGLVKSVFISSLIRKQSSFKIVCIPSIVQDWLVIEKIRVRSKSNQRLLWEWDTLYALSLSASYQCAQLSPLLFVAKYRPMRGWSLRRESILNIGNQRKGSSCPDMSSLDFMF